MNAHETQGLERLRQAVINGPAQGEHRMTAETTTASFDSWLWPDHVIGIRESRRLRKEHNAVVNSHADLLRAFANCLLRDERQQCWNITDRDFEMLPQGIRTILRAAIANASPKESTA